MNVRIYKSPFFIYLPAALLLFSCTTKTVIYTADCNGTILTLQLVREKTFSTIDYHHELIYNGKVVDVITYDHLSFTLPYTPAVYGSSPWHLIDTVRQPYRPSSTGVRQDKIPVMVYVDTTRLTINGFDAFYRCVNQHHKAMQTAIEKTLEFKAYQFGGIVYGSREQFERRYGKNKNDYFTIYPDGRISHILTESLMTITSSGGLSRVHMPGARILVDTAQRPIEELEAYRNPRTNRSLPMDFTFQADTVFHSR